MADPDRDLDTIQQGGRAALVRAELTQRIAAAERRLLDEVGAAWRDRTLTGDDAKAAVAALWELRSLLADVDRTVRRSEQARARVMSPSPPGQRRGA